MFKRRILLSAAAASVLGLSGSLAAAQPRGHDRDDRDRPPGKDRDFGRGPGPHRGPDRWDPPQRHGQFHPDRRDGPPHRWQRGERLPPAYRARYYVVDDWRGHRLQRPPRGYHWVQVGADYVLIAIATGIIAQVILAR
ncbi:RcnB family protein [Pseudorhodoferax sp.]|uniref:RcnB family protein n=1 Tax=Pseudorhodoferax sp. TaxID=1993553 RepID=UPI0039E61B3B